MVPLLLGLALTGVAPMPAAPAVSDTATHRTEDVRYPSGALQLGAELLLPEARRPTGGAVIVQGSGSSDRTNSWSRAIAQYLAGRGIGVLLTDKRGCGSSGGDWRTASFGDLAQDALAGVEYLRKRPEIDSARVGLVGLSQGGWIAPVATVRSGGVAFVINVSGAAVGYAEQTMIEMANTAHQGGLAEPQVSDVLELNRAAGRYLLTGEWQPYARLRDRALRGPWAKIAEGFPASPDLPIWTFLRAVADFDPMPYWILVTQPVLVLYGAEDERDNVPVAESVRRLEHGFRSVRKENYRIVVVLAAGHGFLDGQGRLMTAFTEALGGWVDAHVTQRPESAGSRSVPQPGAGAPDRG